MSKPTKSVSIRIRRHVYDRMVANAVGYETYAGTIDRALDALEEKNKETKVKVGSIYEMNIKGG